MERFVFLDTNYFEHFPQPSDVDWLNLAKCTSAILLVPPVTIGELNKHKDTAVRSKQQERAAGALRLLSGYSKQKLPVYVRNDVEIRFIVHEPLIDFPSYRLNSNVPDDQLLAAALEFANENGLPPEAVLVATADLGLALKIGSRPEIRALELPQNLRLPDQPDEDSRRIRELQAELHALKAAAPKLELLPIDDEPFVSLQMGERLRLESDFVERTLEVLRAELPYLGANPSLPNGWMFANLPQRLLDGYNQALQAYFEKMRSWLREGVEVYGWRRLTPELKLRVKNTGGKPATDLEVTIYFPDGFDVLRRGQLREFAERPQPPLLPAEQIRRFFQPPEIDFSAFTAPTIGQLGKRPDSSARISSIEKSNSHVVRANVPVVKHHRQEELPPLFIHFSNEGGAKSFSVDYEILAGNHPRPFTGTVNVVVKL